MRSTVSGSRFFPMLLAVMALGGCTSVTTGHSRADNTIGGVILGAAAGGAIGTLCCGDPVHGLPAGILIGGVVGGVGGLLAPSSEDARRGDTQ